MGKMTWSEHQEKIFDWVLNNPQSVTCAAVAGSGKTTTAIEAAKRYASANRRNSILFLAFNKTIATELNGKVADYNNMFAKTLHAHGFSAITATLGRGVKVDNKKWDSYIYNNLTLLSSFVTDEWDNIKKINLSRAISHLFNLCRINLIQYNDLEGIQRIINTYSIEIDFDEDKVVNGLLIRAYDTDEVIDYTDMLTMPLTDKVVGAKLQKYNLVFIDEAQDLSKAQQQLMLASITKGGKFVAIGDPHQAINGFAGAMNDSFEQLTDLADGNCLPLSVNYRCGKTIISKAQEVMSSIEAFEGSAEGNVEDVMDFAKIQRGDMIICRKSAPLVGLCLKFIANKQSAYVKGKDVAEGLKKLIVKLKAKNILSLYNKLDAELEKLVADQLKKGYKEDSPVVQSYKDKIECIHIIADSCTSLKQVTDKLDMLFDDRANNRAIALSTIHKAKGLEADNVFIIAPDKLPLKWKGQQEWELQQERNLEYVAITRAKKNLYYVRLDEDSLKSLELNPTK